MYSWWPRRDWSELRADWLTRFDGWHRVESTWTRIVYIQLRPRTAVLGYLLSLSLSLSLFSFSLLLVLILSCTSRPGIYPFLASRFPNSTYSVSHSLVRSKAVSQRRSTAREIPRTRYEFTFLLLYSTLACPPFCLLEPLVYLADLRLPYVSAARLSHWFHSLFLSLSFSPALSACIRMIMLFRRRRPLSFFFFFRLFFWPPLSSVAVDDERLHDAVSRSRKVRYGREEQSRKTERVSRRLAFASRREKRKEADPQIFNDSHMYTRVQRDATTTGSYRCGLLGTVPAVVLEGYAMYACAYVQRPASVLHM